MCATAAPAAASRFRRAAQFTLPAETRQRASAAHRTDVAVRYRWPRPLPWPWPGLEHLTRSPGRAARQKHPKSELPVQCPLVCCRVYPNLMLSCQPDGHQMRQHLGQSSPASHCFAIPARSILSQVLPAVYCVFQATEPCCVRTCARIRSLRWKADQGAYRRSTNKLVGSGRRCHPRCCKSVQVEVSLCCSRTPGTPFFCIAPE